MVRGTAARWVSLALAMVALGLVAPEVRALEAVDGRLQAHGFGEVQVRMLNRNFTEQSDLSQWYNIFNLEVEYDFLPQGWGPIEILQGYARIEARFDCIYTGACGLFPSSVSVYGNEAEDLPKRLRDGQEEEFSGVVFLDEIRPVTSPDIENFQSRDQDPVGLGVGFGFGALIEQRGPDALLENKEDDPFGVLFLQGGFPLDEHEFTVRRFSEGPRGGGGRQQILGPWLPKNEILSAATLADNPNPLRGRFSPTGVERAPVSAVNSIFGDIGAAGTMEFAGMFPGSADPAKQIDDPLDPRVAEMLRAAGGGGLTRNIPGVGVFVFDETNVDTIFPTDFYGGDTPLLVPIVPPSEPVQGTSFDTDPTRQGPADPSDPDGRSRAAAVLVAGTECVFLDNMGNPLGKAPGVTHTGPCPRNPVNPARGTFIADTTPGGAFETTGATSNVLLVGGSGEAPMRPAPDVSNLFSGPGDDLLTARGVYIPSVGFRRELTNADFDHHDFHGSQAQRMWNFGASQKRGEFILKEAYLDIEWGEARWWLRVGKQSTVWGKTELFRTTDQFNPQDLALASLPSLEESRIALWGARLVYSFWNVGPFQDVRAELAVNFDQFEPADLGYCGEPYTANVVCTITNGLLAHGITGVGIAGVDRPPNPWNSIQGLEIGGRLEWRWDRFSFALIDFWGFADTPTPDKIFGYERNVDPLSGRPLVAESRGSCDTASGNDQPGLSGRTLSVNFAPGNININNADLEDLVGYDPGDADDRGNPLAHSALSGNPSGIGTGPDCLQAGGALDDATRNALQYHHANQQLFAMICSGTIGFSNLDPGSCGLTIFGSNAVLDRSLAPIPLVEFLSGAFAGEPFVSRRVFDIEAAAGVAPPLVALNRDRADGVITAGHPAVNVALLDPALLALDPDLGNLNEANPLCSAALGSLPAFAAAGFGPSQNQLLCRFRNDAGLKFTPDTTDTDTQDGAQGLAPPPGHLEGDWLTLDSTLTSEQKALLGCGPFFGTRCDSSDRIINVTQRTDTGDIGVQFAGQAPFIPSAPTDKNFGPTGGLDVFNAEASVIFQSFIGFDGTPIEGMFTTDSAPQPGTIEFEGGPVATRHDGRGGLERLPGARGAESWDPVVIDDNGPGGMPDGRIGTALEAFPDTVDLGIEFQEGYDPTVDGCITSQSGAAGSVAFDVDGDGVDEMLSIDGYCLLSSTRRAIDPTASATNVLFGTTDFDGDGVPDTAGTLFHPLAGCADPALQAVYGAGWGPGGVIFDTNTGRCDGFRRDHLLELAVLGDDQTVQVMQNELAGISFNFLMFLAAFSCDGDADEDIAADPECFDASSAETRWSQERCSLTAPHLCSNVKALWGIAGVLRNDVRAGGNSRFGRRTFVWHSGGEVVLRYDKRNVLGFSMDFAEDVTKSNWGVEFTWISGVPFSNANSFDGISNGDTYNLTVSVDRPTFINFLNANRTFFINTQWFFQYITGYTDGFTANDQRGPFNALFTFAVNTGYFQDRLLPNLVTVFDFVSRSGAVLPSVTYRFTEAFSFSIGANLFFGRGSTADMSLMPFAPASNRVGNDAFQDATEPGLSLVRSRDEAYFRIRWTF